MSVRNCDRRRHHHRCVDLLFQRPAVDQYRSCRAFSPALLAREHQQQQQQAGGEALKPSASVALSFHDVFSLVSMPFAIISGLGSLFLSLGRLVELAARCLTRLVSHLGNQKAKLARLFLWRDAPHLSVRPLDRAGLPHEAQMIRCHRRMLSPGNLYAIVHLPIIHFNNKFVVIRSRLDRHWRPSKSVSINH